MIAEECVQHDDVFSISNKVVCPLGHYLMSFLRSFLRLIKIPFLNNV